LRAERAEEAGDAERASVGTVAGLVPTLLGVVAGMAGGAISGVLILRGISLDVATGVQTAILIVLTLTLLAVLCYTKETVALRKLTVDSNIFQGVSTIHSAINNEYNYNLRGAGFERVGIWYLINAVALVLARAKIADSEIITRLPDGRRSVDLGRLLTKLPSDKQGIESFRFVLDQRFHPRFPSFLIAAEQFLLNLDAVGIPLALGVPAAGEAARSYRSVVEETAGLLLPFVAIENRLSGRDDSYRRHYIGLLEFLEIVPDGFKLSNVGSVFPSITEHPLESDSVRGLEGSRKSEGFGSEKGEEPGAEKSTADGGMAALD